jgi:TM2 domain-containing membrane protein YozV
VSVNFLNRPKSRKISIVLALLGALTPIAGLHKFYLGQYVWGVIYILFWSNDIVRIACAIDAVIYLMLGFERFGQFFNNDSNNTQSSVNPQQIGAIADALRQLEGLRADGLISEYEFEQKRRQLIE